MKKELSNVTPASIKTHNICQNFKKHFFLFSTLFFIFDFYRKSKRFQIFFFPNQSQRTMRLAWTDDVSLRPERAGHSKGWGPDLRLPHIRRRTKRGNRLRPGNVSLFKLKLQLNNNMHNSFCLILKCSGSRFMSSFPDTEKPKKQISFAHFIESLWDLVYLSWFDHKNQLSVWSHESNDHIDHCRQLTTLRFNLYFCSFIKITFIICVLFSNKKLHRIDEIRRWKIFFKST